MDNRTLGELIGVSPSMASRLRHGVRLPSTKVLDTIHRTLGIPLDELVSAHTEGSEAFGALLARAIREYDAARTRAAA